MDADNEVNDEEVFLIYNETDDYRYHHVNTEQINMLLEMLKGNPTLAQGLLRGGQAKGYSKKHWAIIADKLNTVKTGAQKDGKGWSKFWADWKYRVRRKSFELQAARENNTADGILPLTSTEEAVLKIMGQNSANGLVVKKDPLSEDDDTFTNDDDTHRSDGNTSTGKRKAARASKRRHSSDSDNPGSPLASLGRKTERKANKQNGLEGDNKDESAEFLKLEKERLNHTKAMRTQIETIATEMTRLSDAVCQIRDFIMSNRSTLQ